MNRMMARPYAPAPQAQPAWPAYAYPPVPYPAPPAPGQQPAPVYGAPAPAPDQPPRRSTARKALKAGFAVVFVILGLLSFIGKVTPPPASTEFASGGSTSVTMEALETQVIYVAKGHPSSTAQCTVSPTARYGLPRVSEVTSRERKKWSRPGWRPTFALHVGTSGAYTVTCTGAPGDVFRLGDSRGAGGVLGSVIAFATGLFAVVARVLAIPRVSRRRRQR